MYILRETLIVLSFNFLKFVDLHMNKVKIERNGGVRDPLGFSP